MRRKDPCYGFNNGGTFCWWNQLMQRCFGEIINDHRLITKLTVNTFDFYATGDAWTLQNNDVSFLAFLKCMTLFGNFIEKYNK
uniref:Uncharacterized protein n=1 Tax=Acrobeloides nanus TaxID=290746 RepID=A0A914C435_9BILA